MQYVFVLLIILSIFQVRKTIVLCKEEIDCTCAWFQEE